MIIWGSTTKNNIMEQGEFYCPRCRGICGYLHRCVQQYFTLYFIPLFPTNALGEYIECQKCGGTFDPAIRELSAGQIEGLVEPWTCPGCQNLNPASEMLCLRCQAQRAQDAALGKVPPPRNALAQETLAELLPKPIVRRAKNKKKVSDLKYWQQAKESNRCQQCGVRSPSGDLRCRACGSKLGEP